MEFFVYCGWFGLRPKGVCGAPGCKKWSGSCLSSTDSVLTSSLSYYNIFFFARFYDFENDEIGGHVIDDVEVDGEVVSSKSRNPWMLLSWLSSRRSCWRSSICGCILTKVTTTTSTRRLGWFSELSCHLQVWMSVRVMHGLHLT